MTNRADFVLIDKIVTAHVANEHSMLAPLITGERKALTVRLREMLRSLENKS